MTRPPDLKDSTVNRDDHQERTAVPVRTSRGRQPARPGDKLKKKKETSRASGVRRPQEIDGVVDERLIAEVVSK